MFICPSAPSTSWPSELSPIRMFEKHDCSQDRRWPGYKILDQILLPFLYSEYFVRILWDSLFTLYCLLRWKQIFHAPIIHVRVVCTVGDADYDIKTFCTQRITQGCCFSLWAALQLYTMSINNATTLFNYSCCHPAKIIVEGCLCLLDNDWHKMPSFLPLVVMIRFSFSHFVAVWWRVSNINNTIALFN